MVLWSYTLLIVLYLFSVFISSAFLDYTVGAAAVVSLILASVRAKGLYFYAGVMFLLVGIVLFFRQELALSALLLSFQPMLSVLSLFLVLPFLNSIIRVGHYDSSLSTLLRRRVTTLDQLYRRSFFVSHTLGLFLNIATIPVVSNSLRQPLKQLPKSLSHSFQSESLLRGYVLCLVWSPMEVMVSISLDLTGKTYIQVAPIMLLIAGLFFGIAYLFSYRKYRTHFLQIEDSQPNMSHVWRKMGQMGGMLLGFIALTSVFQAVFGKGYLLSVVLVIIPISFVWALLIQRPRRYVKVTLPHWKERTNGLSNYFFMFLSASLFVNMLSASGALLFLQQLFETASSHLLLFFGLIGLYFFVLSLAGFHPLVSMTLLAEMLQPILPAVASIPFAVMLIAGSLSTVMYSPFSLAVSILADLLRINPIFILRKNAGFALLFLIASVFIAYSLTFVFPA